MEGLNSRETNLLIRQELGRHKLTCETGGNLKEHIQLHGDKFDSDIHNLKEGQKLSAAKITEASIMLHEVCANLAGILKNHADNKTDHEKRMDRQDKKISVLDGKLWAIILIFISTAATAFWGWSSMKNTTSEMREIVAKINKADAENQVRTENFLEQIMKNQKQ